MSSKPGIFLITLLCGIWGPSGPSATLADYREDLNAAEQAFRTGDLNAIIYRLGRVVDDQSAPDEVRARALLDRAVFLSRQGNRDRALEDYAVVLARDPKNQNASLSRARLLAQGGRLTEAIVELDRAARYNPQSWTIFQNRGAYQFARRECPSALKDFERAATLAPGGDRYLAINAKAALLATCPNEAWRDGKQALALARRIHRRHPENNRLHHTLALAYAAAGKFEKAVVELEKVILRIAVHEREDLLSVYQDQLASFRRHQAWTGPTPAGQHEVGTTSRAARPRQPAEWKAAVAAYKNGDYAMAFRLMKPLAESGNAPAQFNTGLLYMRGLGVGRDYAKARDWFTRAANKANPLAARMLGQMNEVGQGTEADPVEALTWYAIASSVGDTEAKRLGKRLMKSLTEAQVIEQRKRFKTWMEKRGLTVVP